MNMLKKLFIAFIGLFFTSSALASPQAIATVVAFATSTGTMITFGLATGTTAAIIGAVVIIGTIDATVKILGMDVPVFEDSLASQGAKALSNAQGNTNTLPVIYGKRRVGGTPIFYEVTGDANQHLHMVIAICEGEIESIENIYFNEEKIYGDVWNVYGLYQLFPAFGLKNKYRNNVIISKHLGKSDQEADYFLQNETSWQSTDRLQGVAYVYLKLTFDNDLFGSTGIPQINFDIKGKKLSHPNTNNANPLYSDNPALCIYDYLTNNIYGRSIAIADIDSTSFIAAANECNQEVTVGDKTQKKYTCNGILATNQTPLKAIEQLLTACRGSLIFSGGKYKLIIDAAATAVQTFDESNIVGSHDLAMGGKDYKTNEMQASFINPEKNSQGDFAIVKSTTFKEQDNDLVLKKSIELPYTDQYERAAMIATMNMKQSRQSLVFQFTTTIVGLRAEVGDVCFISLKTFGWNTLNSNSGKKFRITRLELQNNDEVKVVAREYDDDVYNFGAIVKEDTAPNTNLPNLSIVANPVINEPTEELIFAEPNLFNRLTITWDQPNDIYIQSYEISVVKVNNAFASTEFTLINNPYPIEYKTNSEIFTIDSLEAGQYLISIRSKNRLGSHSMMSNRVFEIKNTSLLPALNDPAITGVTESLVTTTLGSGVKAKARLTWTAASNIEWEALGVSIDAYEVEYKLTSTAANYERVGSASATFFDFNDITPGRYDFRVRAVNTAGVKSGYANTTADITALSAAPANVTNFYLRAESTQANLSWTPTSDLDVKVGGTFEIRHSVATSNAAWGTAIKIGSDIPGSANAASMPLLTGTYLIKAVDSTGNKSVTAKSIVNTVSPNLFDKRTQTTVTDTTFAGTKSNMIVDAGKLKLEADTLWDSVANYVDTWGLIDGIGGLDSLGTYELNNKIDMGKVYNVGLSSSITFTTDSTTNIWDNRTGNIDIWDAIDSNSFDDINATFFIATTNDDPASGSATWSDYQEFTIANYYARGFKFKVQCTTEDPTHQIYVSQLQAKAEVYFRIESETSTTNASGTSFTYDNSFLATPTLAITANDMATGDYYAITNSSATGFTLRFYNASGTGISRTAYYLARGY